MKVSIELTSEQVAQVVAAQAAGWTVTQEPAVTYPRVEVIDGSKVRLLAPVNALWTPGMSARMWFNPGTQFTAPEPSNGNDGKPAQPLRSAKGFPLQYTFDDKGALIGTPTVKYADHAFNSDDEVYAYIEAVAKSTAGQVERDRQSGAVWLSQGRTQETTPPADDTTTI